MKAILRHKKVLGLISIFLVIIAASSLWQLNTSASVEASGVVSIDIGSGSGSPPALDIYTTYAVSEKSPDHYEISYPGSGSKIEIGDASYSTAFKADLTISTWDKKAEFKLTTLTNIEEKSRLRTFLDSDTLSASNEEWTFQYKPIAPKDGFNDKGGIDIFITAKEKPASNKIYFSYDSSTVTPYYQASLTEEYQNGWNNEFQCEISVTETQVIVVKDTKERKTGTLIVERPDYVVGSIAFYANGKNNHEAGGINYATGKVGHLYAMQCKGEWCRWSIEGQYIVLTIPLQIFDKAVYPIEIKPVGDTFGYTSIGASFWNDMPANVLTGSVFTGANGVVTSMSVYERTFSGTQIKTVLVDHSSLNIIANGVSNALDSTTPFQWFTTSFTTNPTISNTEYVLMLVTTGIVDFKYDSGSTDQGHNDSSNSFSSPTNPTDATHNTNKYSIYCTYTPGSSPPSISNTPSSYNFGVVNPSNTISTGLNCFTITNNSGFAVNVTVSGTDITGGTTWTLSDTGTPGAGIVGLKAGLDGGSYDIVVKKTVPYSILKSNLAASASQDWGLQILAPTNYTDSVQKAGTVTLTATIP
jgi:hypothetical protein